MGKKKHQVLILKINGYQESPEKREDTKSMAPNITQTDYVLILMSEKKGTMRRQVVMK